MKNSPLLDFEPGIRIRSFGFGAENARRLLRGEERFLCAVCEFRTCGISDPDPNPKPGGRHEIRCLRCQARLCRCPHCREETSVTSRFGVWRCDQCERIIPQLDTLNRNIPTLRQLAERTAANLTQPARI